MAKAHVSITIRGAVDYADARTRGLIAAGYAAESHKRYGARIVRTHVDKRGCYRFTIVRRTRTRAAGGC